MFPVSRFSVKELKIKEIDRQIEEQRSSERALAEQEEDQEKDAQRAANVGKMGRVTGEKLGKTWEMGCKQYVKYMGKYGHVYTLTLFTGIPPVSRLLNPSP